MGDVIIKHYLSFVNPRTGTRERIWFRTKRQRDKFRADLQNDFGTIPIEEWEQSVSENEAV